MEKNRNDALQKVKAIQKEIEAKNRPEREQTWQRILTEIPNLACLLQRLQLRFGKVKLEVRWYEKRI